MVEPKRIEFDGGWVWVGGVWNVIALFAVALGGASLAGCAQVSVVPQRFELPTASRQASVEHNRKTSFVTNRRLAVRKKHTPFASDKNAAKTQVASHGVASFYTEETQTASAERFNTPELTAPHRTWPFGTLFGVANFAG